jgi:hypothetical protein
MDDALVAAAECCPGRFVRDGLLVVVVVKLGRCSVLMWLWPRASACSGAGAAALLPRG